MRTVLRKTIDTTANKKPEKNEVKVTLLLFHIQNIAKQKLLALARADEQVNQTFYNPQQGEMKLDLLFQVGSVVGLFSAVSGTEPKTASFVKR